MKVLHQTVTHTNGLKFKSGHDNPHQAPVPLGKPYGGKDANDSRPKARVADKVDSDKVMHSASSAGTQKNG